MKRKSFILCIIFIISCFASSLSPLAAEIISPAKTENIKKNSEIFSEEKTLPESEGTADSSFQKTEETTSENVSEPLTNAKLHAPEVRTQAERAMLSEEQNIKTIPAQLGMSYENNLSSSYSEHIYTFSVSSRGALSISFNHEKQQNSASFNVSLYQEYFINGNGGEKDYRLLTSFTSSASKTAENLPVIGVLAGNYKISVTAENLLPSGDYSIKTNFTESTQYEIECNDNIYRYTEIYGGIEMYGSSSRYNNGRDEDWYMFRMPADGYINLSFSHSNENLISVGWRVTLTNDRGEEIYSVNSALSDKTIESGDLGLSSGIYYITVYSRVYSPALYTVKVSRNSSSAFESEPNDSNSAACYIPLNSEKSGALTSKINSPDKDFYNFYLSEQGYIKLSFSHAQDNKSEKTGWRVKITDSDGNEIYSFLSAWNESENISPELGLKKGEYYISVDCDGLYRNAAKYTLNLSFNNTSSWETEPNNNIENSTPIIKDSAYYGTVSDELDKDYYKLTHGGGKLTLTLSHGMISNVYNDIFTAALYDQNGNAVPLQDENGTPLTDSSGNLITQFFSNSNNLSVSGIYYSLPAGDYFIKITAGRFIQNIRYSISYS